MTRLRRGLYAITDAALTPGLALLPAAEAALRGGAVAVQYRDKGSPVATRTAQAEALAALCRRYGATFIVNDDVDLAARVGADGVHIGREDCGCRRARAQLGADAVIGVSCYNRLELALAAAEDDADYVAFGSFFPSPTKPEAVRATPELLREAKRRLAIPVVAIGGITAANGATLVEAGADLLAVISEVFGADDVEAAARRFATLYT